MTETGWQAIGRIAKERRERLGLNQEDLADYGGPKVSTVGKFERASQQRFPLRTLHQIERALGWSLGTIEEYVAAHDAEGNFHDLATWAYELVAEDLPDLSRAGADASRPPDMFSWYGAGSSSGNPPSLRQELENRFSGAVEFAEYVRRNFPGLGSESANVLLVVTHLYRSARVQLNDDGYLHELAATYIEKSGDDLERALDLAEQDTESGQLTRDGHLAISQYLVDRYTEVPRSPGAAGVPEQPRKVSTSARAQRLPQAARTMKSAGRAARAAQDAEAEAGEAWQDEGGEA